MVLPTHKEWYCYFTSGKSGENLNTDNSSSALQCSYMDDNMMILLDWIGLDGMEWDGIGCYVFGVREQNIISKSVDVVFIPGDFFMLLLLNRETDSNLRTT